MLVLAICVIAKVKKVQNNKAIQSICHCYNQQQLLIS